MKTLQTFLVRTKIYLAKEQSRQLEFFQKKIQSQHSLGSKSEHHNHGSNSGNNASLAGSKVFIIQRQRQLLMQLRPFQRFLSTTFIMQAVRHTYSYNALKRLHQEDNSFRRELEESLEQSAFANGKGELPQQNLEGILEIFNTPPKGFKEFCGKFIELNFQHVAETLFPMVWSYGCQDDDNMSVVLSQYISEDEYNMMQMPPTVHVERIRHGENLLNLTMMRSEYSITEENMDDEDTGMVSSYFISDNQYFPQLLKC